MSLNVEPLVTLLKRALKSGYTDLVMANRSIMGCYNPVDDSEVGFHYMLHIPDDDKYDDDFYDMTFKFNVRELIGNLTSHSTELTELRKDRKLKPKEASVVFNYECKDTRIKFEVLYKLLDEIEFVEKFELSYPISNPDPVADNIVATYSNLIERVDPSGQTIVIDCLNSDILENVMESVRIYYVKLMIDDVKVRLPLIKSMLNGNKKFEDFYISVRRTNINGIYLYALHFKVKGIIEQYIGYVQNF